MKIRLSILLVLFLTAGCKDKCKDMSQEHLVMATIWYQQSPEAKALYQQGFNLAKERLLEFTKIKSTKPFAIITDIDETILDNSPFQAKAILTGKEYSPEFWNEWVVKASATATFGAVDFSKFCDSLRVQLIYLSNRAEGELEPTMRNMDSLGFSFVTPDNFLLKVDKSGKENRRQKVLEKFNVIMLLGDNLNDFTEVFESRGDDWGVALVEKYKSEFGRRFIVFPNPMYGDWEKNLYDNQRNLSWEEKYKKRSSKLNSF
jgi:5'-nucleotidase (lipoprotein e(P4) family)